MDNAPPVEQRRRLRKGHGSPFRRNFPEDVFAELEAALRADGLLGADEDLTLDNAKAILKDVELGTLTVNTKGEYTFELPPDARAGSILVDTLQQVPSPGGPSTIPSPTRTARLQWQL